MRQRLLHKIIVTAMVLSASVSGCGGSESAPQNAPKTLETLDDIFAETKSNPYDICLDSAPDEGCRRMKVKDIGPHGRVFNDSNYLHLNEAREIGIDIINSDDDIWQMRHPLVGIRSCREYYIAELSHSYPYLVREAADLLHDIGARFNDSLAARGGGNYRIKVTSVLRTPLTVKRLRRINRNAVDSSAHQFGTTFDISYSKFICDSLGVNRTFEDLKNLLGEIVDDLRREGRCYVKREHRQSCFHITARARREPLSDKNNLTSE